MKRARQETVIRMTRAEFVEFVANVEANMRFEGMSDEQARKYAAEVPAGLTRYVQRGKRIEVSDGAV